MARRGLQFLGHPVGEEELGLIREVVASCRGLSRMELAATVCELMGWTRRSGKVKARECREFLERLEGRGQLVLPEKRRGRPVGRATEIPLTSQGEAAERWSGSATSQPGGCSGNWWDATTTWVIKFPSGRICAIWCGAR